MKMRKSWLGAAAVGASLLAQPAAASSHRESLAVLNEPCADTTDVYAWVKPGTHDKLYLIANFLPLHEPGQGNQGLRACEGYRYEFHVGKGTSLADVAVYQFTFGKTLPTDDPPDSDTPLGSNELLWQVSGGTETYSVARLKGGRTTTLGSLLNVAPNDHGPQTDRLVNGLDAFQGYDSGDATSRTVDLYDDNFVRKGFVYNLSEGFRAFAGQRDDPFYLDEKGIFDIVNLCQAGFPVPIAGARTTGCEDVFAGFNLFTVALEVPITDLFPGGIPHNGVLDSNSTDSLLRVWFGVTRRTTAAISTNSTSGYTYSGAYKPVARQALPLFNAGLVGTARQVQYLRSTPMTDVTNFGADILYPVLVRDAELLGIYAALGIPQGTVDSLKGPRLDIINAINLGRPIPIADGSTGDVITLDAAIDSQFPNGRQLIGGSAPNKEQVDVSDVLISLIAAGSPTAGLGDGVNGNDKPYLTTFPFVPAPHSGLNGGHGAVAP